MVRIVCHTHLCLRTLTLLKAFLLSSTLYTDSLHPHVKRSTSIFHSHLQLTVKSQVHRAALSLSRSMPSLTTHPFPLLWPSPLNFACTKQTSPFISVNYRPLLAMTGSSNIEIKSLKYGSALDAD